MKNLIDFLARLRENNNKQWFDSHKDEYKEVWARYTAFAGKLIGEVAKFDPDAAVLEPKHCTYRIYRDLRFSKGKGPYKNALGVYICRGGKKTEYAGYYIHFEPEGEGSEGCFITAGVYMPQPAVLKSIREEIVDNGAGIEKAIKEAKGFRLWEGNKLKKNPVGFPPGCQYDEYLKLKDLYIIKHLDLDYVTGGDLARRAAADFRRAYPLIGILNRAVEYAYEENGTL